MRIRSVSYFGLNTMCLRDNEAHSFDYRGSGGGLLLESARRALGFGTAT